jgi:hypothetical protein
MRLSFAIALRPKFDRTGRELGPVLNTFNAGLAGTQQPSTQECYEPVLRLKETVWVASIVALEPLLLALG